MNNLNSFIGTTLILIGGFASVTLNLFYHVWKTHLKKTQLLPIEFARAIRLIGISMFTVGFGVGIVFSENLNWVAKIVTIIVCSSLCSIIGTGTFILDMKRRGKVKPTCYKQ